MKKIDRDLIFSYQPLSDIQFSKDEKKVYFVSTKADVRNNDYKQDLRVYDVESGKTDNKFFKLCTYYRLEEWQAETGFTIGNLPEAMNNNDIIYNYYHYVEITLERLKTFHVNKNA